MIRPQLVHSFTHAALSPDPDLAIGALMIARIEYPKLDAGPYLDRLDELGLEARLRVAAARRSRSDVPPNVDPEHYAGVTALNEFLFGELHFVGNEVRYDDPRNSCLNEVLDRRTGIPITLALLYMEVARRAELHVEGVNFPGHFLLRCPAPRGSAYSEDLIIDAFHGGALLSQEACLALLRKHTDADDPALHEGRLPNRALARADKQQILARMLINLKRTYIGMCSFPQARDITELLLAVNPSSIDHLRDRGLLAYQLKDFPAALRDLQNYLQLSSKAPTEGGHEDLTEIWEHVKTLRRRLASLN